MRHSGRHLLRSALALLLGSNLPTHTLWGFSFVPAQGSAQGNVPSAPSPARIYPGWLTYLNRNYNFTLQYPMEWETREGLNMSGVNLRPRDAGKFRLPPEMGAGGAVGQPNGKDENRPRTLEEHFQSRLDALKEYGHATDVIVLSKKSVEYQCLPAIVSTLRYRDARNGDTWFDKEILIHTPDDGLSYSLSLHSALQDRRTLVPLFDKMARSFRILGPRA